MDLEGVEGVDGKLKVWIRRVWTLEMVRYCAPPDPDISQFTVPSPGSSANYPKECYWPALIRYLGT